MPFTGKTGLNWGGEYSRWNYDEAKAYLMVAKMMREPGTANGIPLLDAELNENTEILLNLIRRLIQRIHGNGADGAGFKIVQSGSNPNNNFTISGGDGTPGGDGYMFVDGWMPVILANTDYTAQTFGPQALTTPAAGDRADEVYIDVYYKEYSPVDDPDMKDVNINLETSRRIGLVWEVKVIEGGVTPANYVDGNNIPHYCHRLAIINRVNGNAQITNAMIIDARNTKRRLKREYVHTQPAAASTWTVKHYLGTQNLNIRVSDDTGAEVEPDIAYTDLNTISLTFNGNNVAGKALIQAVGV